MNKKKVDQMIPEAYERISKIAQGGKLEKAYRSHVASFGAAMATGSVLAAVSNFVKDDTNSQAKNKQGKKLGEIMWKLYEEYYKADMDKQLRNSYKDNQEKETESKDTEDLSEYLLMVHSKDNKQLMNQMKNQLKEIAVAMKLAMNFFELVEKEKSVEK